MYFEIKNYDTQKSLEVEYYDETTIITAPDICGLCEITLDRKQVKELVDILNEIINVEQF